MGWTLTKNANVLFVHFVLAHVAELSRAGVLLFTFYITSSRLVPTALAKQACKRANRQRELAMPSLYLSILAFDHHHHHITAPLSSANVYLCSCLCACWLFKASPFARSYQQLLGMLNPISEREDTGAKMLLLLLLSSPRLFSSRLAWSV